MAWDSTELAWSAGFIDGEGHFRCQRNGRADRQSQQWAMHLAVGQVDPAPLYRLQSLFGGYVYGPTANRSHKPNYTWRLNGYERVQACVAAIWPYLSVKQPQAATALREFVEHRRAGRPYVRRAS